MDTEEQLQSKLHDTFQRHGVAVAYLFGSVSRGQAGPTSDADIAVLFQIPAKSAAGKMKRESSLADNLSSAIDREVDLIDLAEVTSPLLRHRAVRRGVLLYCTDHRRRHQLELNVLHEYEDTRHLRATANRAMYDRLKSGTFGQHP